MRIAGHSYDNDVFKSLKNILEENIENPTENTTSKVAEALNMSSVTQGDYDNVYKEKLSDIAAELSFAASNYNINIDQKDLNKFFKEASDLRGKDLERAARKYCSNISAEQREPQGTTKMADSQNSPSTHAVAAATVAPGERVEQGNQGYLGMSKNPNTIWDTDVLRRKSQIQSNDEKTAAIKAKETEFKIKQKKAQWKQQAEGGDVISKGIIPSGHAEKFATGQNLPENSMSMFSDKREFENIPEKTTGEKIKDNKSINKDNVLPEIKGTKKADNSGTSFFQDDNDITIKSNIHRSSIDKLFDAINQTPSE